MSEAEKPSTNSFCWNELMTGDVKKAKEFYHALFGWEFEDHKKEHMTYTMLKLGEKHIGGMLGLPPDKEQEIPPHWMSYIYVEDLDKAVEKAKKLGAVIKVEKNQAGEFGFFAVIQDPTGAHFALWQSKTDC